MSKFLNDKERLVPAQGVPFTFSRLDGHKAVTVGPTDHGFAARRKPKSKGSTTMNSLSSIKPKNFIPESFKFQFRSISQLVAYAKLLRKRLINGTGPFVLNSKVITSVTKRFSQSTVQSFKAFLEISKLVWRTIYSFIIQACIRILYLET
ncbi:hypothetical protein KIN20_024541 [Parelaphostrongylus tenuis]|uniref:Uncharacterized protein n=1 Tax=Parelaphostrongylus tenuis TaxID=148309 RepID=A0AAD5NA17_PARTN|nr:hypothetical protein KIN20_024541 [Parelaphostrongylus tenuis]